MSKPIPLGYTRDANGNMLTYKNSNGYWEEYTRDANGEVLTYKDSTGDWAEYTRDANGRMLTYKDSEGVFRGFSAMSTQDKVLAKIKMLEKRFAERKGA